MWGRIRTSVCGIGRRAKALLRRAPSAGARRAVRFFNRLPVLCLILLAAGVIVFVVVIVGSMFTGGTASRTLGVGVAGVAASLIGIFWQKFGTLFTWVSGQVMSPRHGVVIAVLVVLFVPVGLAHDNWLPGVLNDCYTPPAPLPFSDGTALVQTQDGRCYGLIDTEEGLFNPGAFGGNPITTGLERQILAHNQPLEDGDLTAVWLGSLSCAPSPTDPARCADGRDYPAERDQLRGLRLAQAQIAARTGHHLHIVIANATQDVDHIDDVAQLIVARRADFGRRLVVIGGGDSRDTTQHAINRLLDHGIPLIAPNLIGDLGKPGQPFVQRPGYLQLAPPNLTYATDTVTRIKKHHPDGFRLNVFQLPNRSDQYTTSLVNDLLATVAQHGGPRASARHINSLDKLGTSICRTGRPGPPTVLFFADRWPRFGAFLQRVNDVCGYSPPQWVIADGSVSRFMASNPLRATSNAIWPLDYYVGGLGCSELRPSHLSPGLVNTTLRPTGGEFACANHENAPEAKPAVSPRDTDIYCTLDASSSVSQPCRPNDLGAFVAPAWDAAMLADALIPAKSQDAPGAYLRSLNLSSLALTEGRATVRAGQLTAPVVPVRMWHVQQTANPTEPPYACPGSESSEDKQRQVPPAHTERAGC
jgi:hypothetical protein